LAKRFLLDTNVLLHDPLSLEAFPNDEVIIPISVLDELDRAKARPDELGRNARCVARMLDRLRELGSLNSGVRLASGSIVRVELNHRAEIPAHLSDTSVDNRILRTAAGLKEDGGVIVVTKDINLRVKCDACAILAQDYEKDRLAKTPDTLYSGFMTLVVPSASIDEMYDQDSISAPACGFPNQFVHLQSDASESHSGLGRFTADGRIRAAHPLRELWGIRPRNTEQKLAMSLLMDPSVELVTLVGRAGSGKTLLAAAAALQHVLGKESPFQRALLSRPIQPMGRDLGFLPGTVEEKLAPWMSALNDNLELLMKSDLRMIEQLKEQGILQVEPLTYIRGRSIPNSFIILDEVQNMSPQEVKTVITRIGEGSKIVLTGDVEQIDNPYVDFASNGLTHAVERLKEFGFTGHITLHKCERSRLADAAAQAL
jgi:PhoH-like ATPase